MMRFLIIIFSCWFSAESIQAQSRLTFDLGMNVSKNQVMDKDSIYSDLYTGKVGFHLGTSIIHPLKKRLAVESGLLFTTKGYRLKKTITVRNSSKEVITKNHLYYLDVPLRLRVYTESDYTNFFASFGGYMGVALFGDLVTRDTDDNEVDIEKLEIGDGASNDFKRFDYGLSFGGGVDFGKVKLGLFYELGLEDIAPGKANDIEARNRVFRISLAFGDCN